ncbi:MAG: DUF3788 domain-containing protein [Coprobacillus sp.]
MIDIKDIDIKPTIDDISDYIKNPLFMELYNYMISEYKAICTIDYSKDVWLKGWNVKFKKAGKSLCVIYPKDKYITVLVVVGQKEKERVQSLMPKLSTEIKNIYNDTQEGMGQRWLMIDLYSHNNVYLDVLKLIQIRREAK